MNPHQITRSIIVQGQATEIFDLWSDLASFPQFVPHLKLVEEHPHGKSHWVYEGPMGALVAWDAEITLVEPGKRLGWRSTGGGDVKTSGQVTFDQLANGQTQVTLMMLYVPQDARAALGGWLQSDDVIEEALRRFKEHAEHRKPVAV
jgi:uncharacterized membrane protein